MALRLSTGLVNYVARTGALDAGITNSYVLIYSGAQPADADAAATGTLLVVISAAGVLDAGLSVEDAAATGAIQKTAAEVWSGLGLAAGVMGWFRMIVENTNQATTVTEAGTLSTTSRRLDGVVAASGGQLNMSNTTVAVSASQTVSTFTLTLPQSA